MNNTKIQLYKIIKIALPSTATVVQNDELDSVRKTMFYLVGSVLSTANSKPVDINPLKLTTLGK